MLTELPKKNDLMMLHYGGWQRFYVHEKIGSRVLVGPKSWLVSSFELMNLEELNQRQAEVVGRVRWFWPFRFYIYNK